MNFIKSNYKMMLVVFVAAFLALWAFDKFTVEEIDEETGASKRSLNF